MTEQAVAVADQVTPPRKTRAKVAEEKSMLRAELATLVDRVPAKVNAGSIQTTRQWVDENAKARSAMRSPRSSRRALLCAVDQMRGWTAC